MSENSKRPKVAPVSFLRSVREEESRNTNWGQVKQGLDAWVFGVACKFSDPIPHLPDGKWGFRQRSLRGWLFLLCSALEKIHSKHSSLKLHKFIYFLQFSWLSQNYSSASCSDRVLGEWMLQNGFSHLTGIWHWPASRSSEYQPQPNSPPSGEHGATNWEAIWSDHVAAWASAQHSSLKVARLLT